MAEEAPKRTTPAALTYELPGSVKTLKKSYNQKLEFPDSSVFVKELLGESDRAAVILAAAMLDDLLANAIALKMPHTILVEDMQAIFHQARPLGSFSARIEIANLFGIIDDDVFRQLTILREMRNACAHTKHKIGFNDSLLANVALHFFKNGNTNESLIKSDMKGAFCMEAMFLAGVLAYGREKAQEVQKAAIAEAVSRAVAALKASPDRPHER